MNTIKPVFIPDHLYGIIGYPLGHSLSPLLHNWGFQHYNLKAIYCKWPMPTDRLPEFVAALRTLSIPGVSVTIPHKRAIMPYLDGLTADAMHAGAVNTLFWRDGELWGDNTDVQGFLEPLTARRSQIRTALVLGVGGASRAVVWGLKRFGVERVTVCGRSSESTVSLARDAGCVYIPWEERGQWSGDLLVNATPLGMSGKFRELSPWPGKISNIHIAYDLVYNPQETCFLRQAKEGGIQRVGGLEMFIAQAQGQFRLWTKKELPNEPVRELLSSALGEVG
ncbi:shikimate dehydrogenase [Desulfonatronum sp. SC1]|uniref:shikimate dehydrogenase n=1 Tax=Desulfonatronum sp. SC1 TaxID=2109626 RepID=UPI000D2F8F91|nr:shikimate dehydrogenase [Desulfonatronum sp. SC1]PTN36536.1 shikimate dehydrogenase [Desulfonatronum sp. SC1]